MGLLKKRIGYFEILYQNIKILREISKARSRKKLMRHFAESKNDFSFKDKRLEALFQLYLNRFPTRGLERVIAFLIKDMERFGFEHSSSVPQRFEPQYVTHQNRYDKLRGVNLLSHTARVFIIACNERRDLPDKFMEQIVLLALAHDFGKNSKVIDIAAEGRQEKHNQISAKYLSLVMRNLGGFGDTFIDSMTTTLYFHHASNTEVAINGRAISSTFIEVLNYCDSKARDEELRSINNTRLIDKQKQLENGE